MDEEAGEWNIISLPGFNGLARDEWAGLPVSLHCGSEACGEGAAGGQRRKIIDPRWQFLADLRRKWKKKVEAVMAVPTVAPLGQARTRRAHHALKAAGLASVRTVEMSICLTMFALLAGSTTTQVLDAGVDESEMSEEAV